MKPDLVKDNEVAAQLASASCEVSKAKGQGKGHPPPLAPAQLLDGPLLQAALTPYMHTLQQASSPAMKREVVEQSTWTKHMHKEEAKFMEGTDIR